MRRPPNRDPLERGEALVEWAAALDLRLVNKGREGTCIR